MTKMNLDGTWKVKIKNAWWGFLLHGNVKIISGNRGYNWCWFGKWGRFDIQQVGVNRYQFIYKDWWINDLVIESDGKGTGRFFWREKERATFTMEKINHFKE